MGILKRSENLSANTLFHFTDSLEALQQILKGGLRLSYVAEALPGSLQCYIAPMACFCDIPLGSMKTHLGRYGSYGIGLHKDICMEEKINPVFYVHDPRTFKKILPNPGQALGVLSHIKRYHGMTKHKTSSKAEFFRFYDEREWRYVETSKARMASDINAANRECEVKNKAGLGRLSINPQKIEYLIVKNKKEIHPMVEFIDNHLEVIKKEKQILHTKIITATRIIYDF